MTDFTIQRIRFPDERTKESLYFYREALSYKNGPRQIQRTRFNFCSFFNAFFENYYLRYTSLKEVTLRLRFTGRVTISVFRLKKDPNSIVTYEEMLSFERDRDPHGSKYGRRYRVLREDLFCCERAHQGGSCEEVTFEIPFKHADLTSAGILGFSIALLDDKSTFVGGEWSTRQKPTQDIRLSIVTTTFKRERYIKETIGRILDDARLYGLLCRIIVIDNARSLSVGQFEPFGKVTVIHQDNFGGAGGTTRGFIEGLQDGETTHFLVMDDDIELETDSILRTISIFSFARERFAVHGTMFDLLFKERVFEAGALWATPEPYDVYSVRHWTAASDVHFMEDMVELSEPHYGAWWFFAFPRDVLLDVGLPMPFFIHGDDIEFGLRMRGKSVVSVPFPSVGVWHHPFYAKNSDWMVYYDIRNYTIIQMIASNQFSRWTLFRHILRRVTNYAFRYDYLRTELTRTALDDVLRGPAILLESSPEAIHSKLLDAVKKNLTITKRSSAYALRWPRPQGVLRTIFRLLTLNGHLFGLLPIRSKKSEVCIDRTEFGSAEVFGYTDVIVVNYWNGDKKHFRRDLRQFLRVYPRAVISLLRLVFSFGKVKQDWRRPDLRSRDFWTRYLRIGHGSPADVQCDPGHHAGDVTDSVLNLDWSYFAPKSTDAAPPGDTKSPAEGIG